MPGPYKHIFISENVKSEKYKASSKQGTQPVIPQRDRIKHSKKLLQQFEEIWKQKNELHQTRSAEKIATREGTYLSFTSAADHDLITKSLENIKKGIRLLNVREEKIDDSHIQKRAIIYIPNGLEGFFIKKITQYENENVKSGRPKNASLINSIEDVSIALLEGLWTDKLQLMPAESSKWCEVWLNIKNEDEKQKEQIDFFSKTLTDIGIAYKTNTIIFPERAVMLINANRSQLIELMLRSDFLAEFRAGQEPAGFWVNESTAEQQAWVEDLISRIERVDSNIKVCILDTGVNNGHQLLRPLIDEANTLSVEHAWGTNDHEFTSGHGTLMAGIVGYGAIEKVLLNTNKIFLTHTICSVKILPPPGSSMTPKELWGDITAQGIARAEIQNPEANLVYCLSVTSKEDTEHGRPSSWSGAIDNLAYNDGENQRLIVISAGNIRNDEAWQNYPDSNFTTTIENPAQSWNSLVIGAYTEKIQVSEDIYSDYKPIANLGELSPYSTTSLIWDKKWPIKPDIVLEGGNLLKGPDGSVTAHEDLELLSTSKRFNIKPFDTINATSAAAAEASWFAAKIAYEYPLAWSETIRGLMVHSAIWLNPMKQQLSVRNNNRGDFRKLLRVYGYGVPQLNKALYSQENSLIYIAQEEIQPYKYKDGSRSETETNEIHFYNLPWPGDLLIDLGATPVTLKVTLSYFIEPGAGEIGWKDKYRYQSHGLRFDINNIGEEEDDFRKRVNMEAREENEEFIGKSGSNRWAIGANNRSTGSIHSDFWEGTAASLATCNLIAVFPVIGWWRERQHLGKVENTTRYSLIISLETPIEEIELYTTVKNLIEIPVEIKT